MQSLKKRLDIDFFSGEIILIDKPLNWTSFDVVKKIKNLIRNATGAKKIKIGHAGTLDPLATGLMILCTGKATKKLTHMQLEDKVYQASFCFGATTPSFDLETEINEKYSVEHISKNLIEKTIRENFTGDIKQVPPIFSAKSINGKRAYNLARKGETAKLEPVSIHIKNFEILEYDFPEVIFQIECSKGTYIRSLAHDLGRQLNSGAYLSGLQRMTSGNFHIKDAVTISEFEKILKNLNKTINNP